MLAQSVAVFRLDAAAPVPALPAPARRAPANSTALDVAWEKF